MGYLNNSPLKHTPTSRVINLSSTRHQHSKLIKDSQRTKTKLRSSFGSKLARSRPRTAKQMLLTRKNSQSKYYVSNSQLFPGKLF